MNAAELMNAIELGEYDAHIGAIAAVAKQRQLSMPIKVGDSIVVNDNVSPKYMSGIRGKVHSVTGKRQRGQVVYMIEVDPADAYKLAGTRMTRYDLAAGEYKVSKISMARDLIKRA